MAIITYRQRAVLEPRMRMSAGMRLSTALVADATEFNRIVKEVEGDPLVQNLFFQGVIRRKRLPGISVADFRTDTLREDRLSASTANAGTGFSVAGPEELAAPVNLLRRLGRKDYVAYFLAPEDNFTAEAVSQKTGLTVSQVKKLVAFTDRLCLEHNFQQALFPAPPPPEGCRVVAAVEREGDNLVLADLAFDPVRGVFNINEEKLRRFKSGLSGTEKKRVKELLDKIWLINSRRLAIYQLLKALLKNQPKFIVSGRSEDLKPLSQRKLAEQCGYSPSAVNRAVKGRGLRILDGTVVPLPLFFSSSKRRKQGLVRAILRENRGKMISDRKIAAIMSERFRVKVSRRAVNLYRREVCATGEPNDVS